MNKAQFAARVAAIDPNSRDANRLTLELLNELNPMAKLDFSSYLFQELEPANLNGLWSSTGLYLSAMNMVISEQQKQIDRLTEAVQVLHERLRT